MRLLNTRTLQLHTPRDDEVPSYAILSHTWGDDELTLQALQRLGRRKGKATGQSGHFSGHGDLQTADRSAPRNGQDVVEGPVKKRKKAAKAKVFAVEQSKGYLKVSQAAELAGSRGFDWLWVDTCCIDKTSSSELSEAINSMYAWYQRAAECYVYLAEVEAPPVPYPLSALANAKINWRNDANNALLQQLISSRWFRRGWTLQELIAPRTVIFYAKDWSPLGEKTDDFSGLQSRIAGITGIEAEVLDGRIEPSQLSIATRMSWAAKRQTTRPEDIAYCLMGLFDVNMPLLYGEGMKAFTRLQVEIISRNDDQSIYAWRSYHDESGIAGELPGDHDPDALSGLLASHPRQFRASMAVQALPPSPVNASMPSGMTNNGLTVRLYLRPVAGVDEVPMEEDYFAILDCFVANEGYHHCPVLRLRKLSDDQYGRLETWRLRWFPPIQYMGHLPRGEGYRTIFVRQQPVYYHMPEFRIDPSLRMGRHEPDSEDGGLYRLKDTHPPRQWNSATMTMKAHYSRKLQAMGLFRFEHAYAENRGVDVVVGLRRLDAMQWEGWCFQRAWAKEKQGVKHLTCTSVLEAVNQGIADLDRRQRQGMLTSDVLRDALGDDGKLVTIVDVQALQVQGRLYINVNISAREEADGSRPIAFLQPDIHNMAPSNLPYYHLKIPYLRDFQVQLLSSAVAMEDSQPQTTSGNPGVLPFAVRTRPATETPIRKQLRDYITSRSAMMGQTDKGRGDGIDNEGSSNDLLAFALFRGDSDRVGKALEHVADLSKRTADPFGLAPIHWAVAGGSPAMVHEMLSAGADLGQTTGCGWTTLHMAAVSGCPLWKQTHKDEFELSDKNSGTLYDAVHARTHQHGDTPVHLAAAWSAPSYAGLEYFEELWGKSLDSQAFRLCRNFNDETPLHRAAAANSDKIVRFLISDSMRYLSTTTTSLDVADRLGRTPLWHASAAGATDALQALLFAGASSNLADDMGLTPLHAACRMGRPDAVGLLTKHNVPKTARTMGEGFTPLDFAAMWGHVDCLQQLLWPLPPANEHAALYAACNRALHMASSCGTIACARELFRYGARASVEYPVYYMRNWIDGRLGKGIYDHVRVVGEKLSALDVARKLGFVDIVSMFLHRDTSAVELPGTQPDDLGPGELHGHGRTPDPSRAYADAFGDVWNHGRPEFSGEDVDADANADADAAWASRDAEPLSENDSFMAESPPHFSYGSPIAPQPVTQGRSRRSRAPMAWRSPSSVTELEVRAAVESLQAEAPSSTYHGGLMEYGQEPEYGHLPRPGRRSRGGSRPPQRVPGLDLAIGSERLSLPSDPDAVAFALNTRASVVVGTRAQSARTTAVHVQEQARQLQVQGPQTETKQEGQRWSGQSTAQGASVPNFYTSNSAVSTALAAGEAQQSVTLPAHSASAPASRRSVQQRLLDYVPAPRVQRSSVDPSRYSAAMGRSTLQMESQLYGEAERSDLYGPALTEHTPRDTYPYRTPSRLSRPVGDRSGTPDAPGQYAGQTDLPLAVGYFPQPETDPALIETIPRPSSSTRRRALDLPLAPAPREPDPGFGQHFRHPGQARRGSTAGNLRDLMGKLHVSESLSDGHDEVSPVELAPDHFKHHDVRLVASNVELDATSNAASFRSVSPLQGSVHERDDAEEDKKDQHGQDVGSAEPYVPTYPDMPGRALGAPFNEDGAFSSTWTDMGYYGYGRR